jgi:hypothetical protein
MLGGSEAPPGYVRWSQLSRFGKAKRVFVASFVVWHLAAMFLNGGSSKLRRLVSPVFSVYVERLKLTNTWGMFSKRPSSTHVRIEAVDASGERHLLSTTGAGDKGLVERFKDARLRKVQSKIGVAKDRVRFGNDYLDGWCRLEGKKIPDVVEVRAVQEIHELFDDHNRSIRKAKEQVILRRTCGPKRPRNLTVQVEDRDEDEGEDT